jgi:glycosyltransferase involved in cell wall biosynthesis
MADISNQPLISVIINCHNGDKYLKQTIDSIFDQNYENWEIIFWDNMSTDNSAYIIKSYSDKRIKYYMATEYTPLGEARNLAIEKATGKWCSFLDSDDIWMPDKLGRQVEIINKDSDSGVIYGQMLVYKDSKNQNSIWSERMCKYSKKTTIKKLPEGEIFNQLLRANFVPLLTAIFKKDLFIKAGGVSKHMDIAEDYDLFLKLSRLTKFKAVQDVVAYYRVHSSNASIVKQEQSFSEVLEIINKYLPEKGAIYGLKVHNTVYSIFEIRDGRIVKGLVHFIKHGSINSILYLMKRRFF